MTTIDAIALRRAEEQLQAGAWRRSDRGEHLVAVPPPACEVCGQPARPGNARTKVDLCGECHRKGWRSRRCACGRPLRTFDYDRGECSACRRERNARELP